MVVYFGLAADSKSTSPARVENQILAVFLPQRASYATPDPLAPAALNKNVLNLQKIVSSALGLTLDA